MTKQLLIDIIGWDTVNWGESLGFFEENIDYAKINTALELGSGDFGGYSLYFASKNIQTICSKPIGNFKNTKKIHDKYVFRSKIKYEVIDALKIPYKDNFDCIVFKSLMCIIGNGEKDRFINLDTQKYMIAQASKALKKDGYLIFSDNLIGSNFHQYINNNFGWGKGGTGWRYFSVDDYLEIIGDEFDLIGYRTVGVLGFLGKYEWFKRFLGKIDKYFLNSITEETSRYIFICVCKKKDR